MKRMLSLSLVLLCSVACLRPSEQRAERDLEIGRADAAGLKVNVQGGLAAVRSVDGGTVRLWGSAPSWEFDLERDSSAPELWTLELQNVLPDAVLSTSETLVETTQLPSEVTTRQRFRVRLPTARVHFRLGPSAAASGTPLRFALLSDVQEAIDRVYQVFDRINAEPEVRFLLGAGDLTRRGTPSELEQFQNELLRLKIPYFTTLGNHELGDSEPTPYQTWFGRANFQFEFQGVVFTLIDSASATIDPLVYEWLETWLDRAKDRVHIVAMHIPPLDPCGVRNGAFASRGEAGKILGRLAEARVDLTLYGHVHSFYAFDNAGIPAFISGGGGAIPERFDNIGRHFMVIDVDEHRVLGSRVVRVD